MLLSARPPRRRSKPSAPTLWATRPIKRATTSPKRSDHYKRALELDPKLAMAWARLGVLKLNTGAVSEAAEYFTRA